MLKKLLIALSILLALGIAFVLMVPIPLSSVKYKQFHVTWAQAFRNQYKPQIILPLSDIVRERASTELNQTDFFLPHYHRFNEEGLFNLQKYALSCENSIFLSHQKRDLEKAWQWHYSRCKNEPLPIDFFKKPPFIHPSGQSFTKLALQEGLLKLDQLEATLTLQEYLQVVLHLKDLTVLQATLLKDRTSFVLNDNFIFLLKENEHTSASYEAFRIEDWNSFQNQATFQFRTSTINEKACIDPNEQGCWVERVTYSALIIKILLVVACALIAIVLGLFIYYRQKNARLKKLEDEKRKFALQMLTHELRTPATSLSLLVENVRQDFDSIGDAHKENFIKICNEVLRLQNMTKASYQYLQTDSLTENFKVNLATKKFSQYFQNLAEKFDHRFTLQMNCHELELRIDWFWLDLCLQNLLRNAFEHGSGKVTLKIKATAKQLCLSVLDEGKIDIPSAELFQAFKKNHKSRGLGLGLSIVHKILTSLNVELIYLSKPQTEFKIIISRDKYEYSFS